MQFDWTLDEDGTWVAEMLDDQNLSVYAQNEERTRWGWCVENRTHGFIDMAYASTVHGGWRKSPEKAKRIIKAIYARGPSYIHADDPLVGKILRRQ